jgi:hypothetical protein
MAYSNVPDPVNLEIRQGSDFGDLVVEVDGVDLSNYTFRAGVTGQVLTPDVTKQDNTTLIIRFSAALTQAMRATQSPYSQWGSHHYWVDLVRIQDGGVEPLVNGKVNVIEKGFQGA